MHDLNQSKLAAAEARLRISESKLSIAKRALSKIAKPGQINYHKIVDEQMRIAEEALAELEG